MTEIFWNTHAAYPLLAILQLLPASAMLLMLLLRDDNKTSLLAFMFAAVELMLAIDLYRQFDPSQAVFQFAEQLPILGALQYHAAVDGVSVLFILLTALLSILVVLYGHIRGFEPRHKYFAVLFATEAALISMFVTLDLLWFVSMSILQLLPVGYLLWEWATSPDKDAALLRFMQFMLTAILLTLGGTLLLGWNYANVHGQWSFDLLRLENTALLAPIQSITFFMLFYGLAIRIPLFPLHGWLPRIAEHGSVAVAPVFLLGVKTGIYGLFRFVLPLLSETIIRWDKFIVAFAVIGVFYAALLALLQTNLRRVLAFAVVSHTSILVIGLFSLNHLAFQGTLLLSANFGLAIAGLLFMTGLVYMRTHTTHLHQLGGLFDRIPQIGVAFLVAGLAIVGMPGTPGFDAAHLVLEASIERFGALVTIAAALGNVVAAGILLWAFQRAFLAPSSGERKPLTSVKTTPLEMLLAGIVVATILLVGFYIEPWLGLIENAMPGLATLYGSH